MRDRGRTSPRLPYSMLSPLRIMARDENFLVASVYVGHLWARRQREDAGETCICMYVQCKTYMEALVGKFNRIPAHHRRSSVFRSGYYVCEEAWLTWLCRERDLHIVHERAIVHGPSRKRRRRERLL